MLQETKEKIALLVTEQRMKEKSEKDFMYDFNDVANWLITFNLVMSEIENAEKNMNI